MKRVPLLPALFVVCAVTIMCSLGFWQLERLAWKEQLIKTMQENLHAPPVNLDLPDETMDLDYHPVTLTGQFVNGRHLYMPARVHDGQVGWHVLSLFEQNSGTIWLINRGWVPQEQLKEWESSDAIFGKQMTLTGIARKPLPPGRFTPPNDTAANLWYFYDPPAMFRALNVAESKARADYVIEMAADDRPETLPIGGITLTDIPNNHLEYAITWFALALILLAVFSLYLAQRRA